MISTLSRKTPTKVAKGGGSDVDERPSAAALPNGLYRPSTAAPAQAPPSRLQPIDTQLALRMGRQQWRNDARSSLPLIAADLFSVVLAVAAAGITANLSGGSLDATFGMVAVVFTLLMQHIHGLYPACGMMYATEFSRMAKTWFLVTVATGIGLLVGSGIGSYGWTAWMVFSVCLAIGLFAIRPSVRRRFAKYDWWTQPVLIVGNGERAARLFDRLSKCRNEGLRPAGVVFDPFPFWDASDCWNASRPLNPDTARQALSEASAATAIADQLGKGQGIHVGPIEELEEILERSHACRLAITDRGAQRWNDFHCFHGIPHVAVPTELGNHPTESVRLVDTDGRVEMHCRTTLTSPQSLVVKRSLDLAIIAIASPFWVPVMVGIVIAMKITDPGPVFYRQARVGRFRTPFQAMKFRSMVVDADRKLNEYLDAHPEMMAEWKATHKLQDDPRVTRIGEFLRKTSLDELPQLINVIVGDMSLVGPRPIIDSSDYDREYIQGHPEVFDMYQMVRPGITGLWQVSGRNGTSYEDRIHFDRYYLHNWSLTFDIFILWRTIKTALYREGAC